MHGGGAGDWKSRRAGVPPGVHLRGRRPVRRGTSPRPLRHMEDAMRRNKLALCLYLVWTTDEQDASVPAQAGARPQALQERFQSLLLRFCARAGGHPAADPPEAISIAPAPAECKTTSHHLCCFISWTEFPARAHTPVYTYTLSSHLQPATCNGRPTRNVQRATFIPSRPSPLASRLSPLTRQ